MKRLWLVQNVCLCCFIWHSFDPNLSSKNTNIIRVCRKSNHVASLKCFPEDGSVTCQVFLLQNSILLLSDKLQRVFNPAGNSKLVPRHRTAPHYSVKRTKNAAAGTLSPNTVVFCVLIHNSSTSSVQLNVHVEKCVTPALPADLITWSTVSLAVLVSPHNETWLLATEKSITSVSHDYRCFLWLYLCTLTVSPFTETVTRGWFVSVRERR